MPTNIESNLKKFVDGGIKPNNRDASFDYCFNYFQSFRDSRSTLDLVNSQNVETSCMQLGFYLASWGMYRGSAELLQKSARYLAPMIELIAKTDISFWDIDAHCYTDISIEAVWVFAENLRVHCSKIEGHNSYMSDTLITKIMLGVFGNVPAFDTYFIKGAKNVGISSTFNPKSLREIRSFYQENSDSLDSHAAQFKTLDFLSGNRTSRSYTRAKVIDMILFAEGESLS